MAVPTADITVEVVTGLIAEQFPQRTLLPVRPVELGGLGQLDVPGSAM